MKSSLISVVIALLLILEMATATNALAGEGGNAGASAATATMPWAVVIPIAIGEGMDCSPSNRPLCDAIIELIRRLLSSHYRLAASSATPQAGGAQQQAEVVYAILRRRPFLIEGLQGSAPQLFGATAMVDQSALQTYLAPVMVNLDWVGGPP